MVNRVDLLFAISLVFLKETGFTTVANDKCFSNRNCPSERLWSGRTLRRSCCRGWDSNTDRICRYTKSCVGSFCRSHRDCNGQGECCVSNKCTYDRWSTDCACTSENDCKYQQYCCRSSSYYRYGKKFCFATCVGQYCSKTSECRRYDVCCRSNMCVECSDPGCRNDDECGSTKHCCKKKQGESICSWSCVGHFCNSSKDCTVPGQCCVRNKCTTTCIGNECVSDTDCGRGETCTNPDSVYNLTGTTFPKRTVSKCFQSDGCFSHNECNIFGTGYYCCNSEKYSLAKRNCSSNCINKFCIEGNDCAGNSSECCGSNNKCGQCKENSSNDRFPVWVIGVILGVLAVILVIGYVCRRRKTRGMHVPSNQSTQPSPTVSQQMYTSPETENEHGNGQFPDLFVGRGNVENETVVPSAPPLPLEPYPSTFTSPPPPSYESLFPNH